MPSGTYVVDAYFIQKVTHIPRRTLLIYPPSVLDKISKDYELPTLILNTDLSVYDIYEMLKSTYEEMQIKIHDELKRIIRRSRLSIIFPVGRAALEVDGEARGALVILKKVFENCKFRAESDIISWSKVSIPIRIELKSGGIVRVQAPNPIPRIYEWLYNVDLGFNEALTGLINECKSRIDIFST